MAFYALQIHGLIRFMENYPDMISLYRNLELRRWYESLSPEDKADYDAKRRWEARTALAGLGAAYSVLMRAGICDFYGKM